MHQRGISKLTIISVFRRKLRQMAGSISGIQATGNCQVGAPMNEVGGQAAIALPADLLPPTRVRLRFVICFQSGCRMSSVRGPPDSSVVLAD